MKITFDNEFEYKPVWNKNREDSKPINARFRYLTSIERQNLVKVEYKNFDGELHTVTTFDNEGVIKATLLKLDNLIVNGEAISTAKDLIGCRGVSSLVNELADYSTGRSITPDLKN